MTGLSALGCAKQESEDSVSESAGKLATVLTSPAESSTLEEGNPTRSDLQQESVDSAPNVLEVEDRQSVENGKQLLPEILETDKPDSEVESEVAAFDPPFPGRLNPFLAPKRTAATTRQNGSQQQASIELLGFANVGQRKAILSINGKVVPVVEGQKEGLVEVISIQPPSVVLQANRERWQVSLEN